MSPRPLVVGLPISDRRRSFDFYRQALGLDAVGEPAEDGVPEPLQFELNPGMRLMLIPRDGFGWVVQPREVAGADASECVLTLPVDDEAEVDAVAQRAAEAGARIVSAPGAQPWAYTVSFTDPDGHLWSVVRVDVAD
jgi:predicted lactoylglutathione lyase